MKEGNETERLSRRHVVLLGIGHTNAHVLRMWQMHAPPDTDLTCISDYAIATYSGRLPAILAQQHPVSAMEVDLVKLCAAANARLIVGAARGIDHQRREVMLQDRPPIPFDVLSIGIGSKATTGSVEVDSEHFIQIKPMQTFLDRLKVAVKQLESRCSNRELRISVVGSGVAGVEIACCLPPWLRQTTQCRWSLSVISSSETILSELTESARQKMRRHLERREVQCVLGSPVTKVDSSGLLLENGSHVQADLVIWATGAAPPDLLAQLQLPLDDRGFLATDRRLQCLDHTGIFAVGDTGTIIDKSLPKAGVYAVRQGPVLWENINRSLDRQPLKNYRPQKSFLKLLNLGDGRALGQWQNASFSGRWVMQLKDWIDSKFLEKYRPEPMEEPADSEDGESMQCRGCGCKLAPDTLEGVLASGPEVKLEDAAPIGGAASSTGLIASTDFFSAPLNDAFLVGRIAALHCASDIIASGAQVTEALANVVLPEGDRRTQAYVLAELLAGARAEFDQVNAHIVGGHTIVGPRMEIGFTVIGRRLAERGLQKDQLRAGDRLLLTKPIGIGVVLAAHMRVRCPARTFEQTLQAMLQPQHALARLAIDHGLIAGTDVTGFGLLGHLGEMTSESDVNVTLDLDAVPALPGALELIDQGIHSSLAPDNRRIKVGLNVDRLTSELAAYELLFDPQTCGGLLLGIPSDRVDDFSDAVAASGLPRPHVIGEVESRKSGETPLITVQPSARHRGRR